MSERRGLRTRIASATTPGVVLRRHAMTWLFAAAFGHAGCGLPMPVLNPAGPGARPLVSLWWVLFWMTAVPAAIVITILLVAVLRARRASAESEAESLPPKTVHPRRYTAYIIWGGAVVPAVILVVLLLATFRTGRMVALPQQEPTLLVQLTGHQFWWEVRYPDHDVVTANEIHLPVGEAARLMLRSSDVIHSFWVPPLHGKIDMVPGHVNWFWLQPDKAGVYRGLCAEFCGIQHALMQFLVIAEPAEDFLAWTARSREPAVVPEAPLARRGQDVFVEAACNQCHAVRGIFEPVAGLGVGPDLTHVASRRTLAAASLANTPQNLRHWVRDPHVRKPGVRMPASPLEPDRLEALVEFLSGLR
jgi:cytochrome c oxidase subunit II